MTSANTTPAARTRRRRAKGHGDGLVLVARVSADEEDNDPKVLLTYIAVALDAVHPAGDALASPVSSGARLGGAARGVGAGGDDRAGGAVRAGSMWAADPPPMQPNGSCVPYPVCGTQGPGAAAWRLISLSFACLVVAR